VNGYPTRASLTDDEKIKLENMTKEIEKEYEDLERKCQEIEEELKPYTTLENINREEKKYLQELINF
jgi:Skp family chaperone for outer membrane proteins